MAGSLDAQAAKGPAATRTVNAVAIHFFISVDLRIWNWESISPLQLYGKAGRRNMGRIGKPVVKFGRRIGKLQNGVGNFGGGAAEEEL
ncbi:hypothetical protein D3C75_889030 [compost metagenome]